MQRSRYDKDTKETLIELYKENPTMKIKEIADQFELPYQTVYSWLSTYNKEPNSSPQRRAKEKNEEDKEVVTIINTPTTPIPIQRRENYPNYLANERNEHLNEQLSLALSQVTELKKELELAQAQACATQDELTEVTQQLTLSKEENTTLKKSMRILFSE